MSGSSPLTCLAWEALPVAYATASIALGIMWPHKPHHYVKLRIPSGGCYIPPSSKASVIRGIPIAIQVEQAGISYIPHLLRLVTNLAQNNEAIT
jgi:hypothetical protein